MPHSVIVATGLIALVDDCIKERWQTKKAPRFAVPLAEHGGPRAFMQHLFTRRNSNAADHPPPASPLRFAEPIDAY